MRNADTHTRPLTKPDSSRRNPLPMNHVNVNRVSLSALGAILFVMLLVAFSDFVISPRTPKVPGFVLPTSSIAPPAAPKAAPEEPLPALLAKADVTKGRQDAKSARLATISRRAAALKSGRTCGTLLAEGSRRSPPSPIPTPSRG